MIKQAFREDFWMMNKLFLTVTVIVAATALPAWAGELPPEFSYIIYVEGERAGTSTTKVSDSGDSYVFESKTVVKKGEFSLDLSTRTEVDKRSFLPVSVSVMGEKMGNEVSGKTQILGMEATFKIEVDGEEFTSKRTSNHPILLLEDYVMAHEVIIARAFWESGEKHAKYGVAFPSMGSLTTSEVGRESEVLFESESKEAYCVKLVVSLQNSSPFASYFDPERGIPVYLAFPGTSTEVFLDEFFDGKPISRYRSP